MKYEPTIDQPALLDTVRRAYGLPASSLTFFPGGMVGCHYVVGCSDGGRYFLTLLTGGQMARRRSDRLDFTLALTRRLVDTRLFPFQPAPHYTLGACLKADFNGAPVVLYEYIEGHDLRDPWPPPADLLPRLGDLAARLHRATPQLGLDIPYVERFSLPFEPDLLASLSEVEGSSQADRPELEQLRQLILPRRVKLVTLLARLHELGEVARSIAPPQVLVHTDLHGGNLIRTPQDEVYVVDWEGAMLAPAEHDLFIFAGEGFSTLLAAYLRTYGSNHLHPELFAYYIHRRLLEDVAEFLNSLLHEDDSPQAFCYDLDLLASSCLAGIGFLDDSVHWAAAQIQAATDLAG